VYRRRRCHVHELPDCTRDPAPDRHARLIPYLPKFARPSRAFYIRLVAVALQHQVSDTPDIDPRDHALESYRSNLYRRLSTSFRDEGPRPHIWVMQNLEVTEDEAAAPFALLTRTITDDRYPLSPRTRAPKATLAKLRPEPAREPLPPPKAYAVPRATVARRRRGGR
jgi:hypothetical protein